MVKTFKEFFDELDTDCQEYIVNNFEWVDTSTSDYYKQYIPEVGHVNAALDRVEFEYSFKGTKNAYGMACQLAYHKQNLGGINDESYYNAMSALCREYSDCMYFLSLNERRRFVFDVHETTVGYNLQWVLFLTTDFNNIPYNLLSQTQRLSKLDRKVIGYDKSRELLKEHPLRYKLELNEQDDLFDDLFFGENGWTEKQRLEIIKNYTYPNLGKLNDFMKRIVSVDQAYLKHLDVLVESRSAISNEAYKEQKPDSEITNGMSIPQKYRYPVEYRKLFLAAGVCARKNMSKSLASSLGDLAVIIKMYRFDFQKVYQSLYPEQFLPNAEDNVQPIGL